MSRKNIIISPSGKLYGSEYVLLDFLNGSTKAYDIYVPRNSVFYNTLKEEGFNVYGFTNLRTLYLVVFFKMLFRRKNMYLNEAGHISYVKFLSKLLPFRKFMVSVRLVEDCNSKLNILSKNVTLIAVSNYIKSKIKSNLEPVVVYDPYALSQPIEDANFTKIEASRNSLKLGVVGRITKSKGGDNLIEILNCLNANEIQNLEILFFGTYDPKDEWFVAFKKKLDTVSNLNYVFKGFVGQKEDIYKSVDVLTHLNKEEPLGRIFFESIDYSLPVLVYKSGGIGELAHELRLSEMAMESSLDYANEIRRILEKGQFDTHDLSRSKKIISENFSAKKYSNALEKYL